VGRFACVEAVSAIRWLEILTQAARAFECEKLGELQHAPGEWRRAVEIGAFLDSRREWDHAGITVCDFTGLGVEDLYIAEYCYEKSLSR
jgi:ornithine cyclodeaminase/alanine dehydrogenase-like protein (mu-crystallin family)